MADLHAIRAKVFGWFSKLKLDRESKVLLPESDQLSALSLLVSPLTSRAQHIDFVSSIGRLFTALLLAGAIDFAQKSK